MPESSRSERSTLSSLVQLVRPRQWVKNFFIFPAALFGHAYLGAEQAINLLCAFAAFCCFSSAVYSLNDVVDAKADRKHPIKKLRPVASGALTPRVATSMALVLIAMGSPVAYLGGRNILLLGLMYLANNVGYSLFVKRKVIADVLSIAIGFLLRILAGAMAAGLKPSSWLLICGFSLALFLGFCKRRSEYGSLSSGGDAADIRWVFARYSEANLNLLVSASATLTIITYMLFTVSAETIARHGTTALIYTSPFVMYCVLRFLMKSLEMQGEDAAETILFDPAFVGAGLGWIGLVVAILHRAELETWGRSLCS